MDKINRRGSTFLFRGQIQSDIIGFAGLQAASAAVPEPGTLGLLGAGLLGLAFPRRKKTA